jgi:crotonobetainyl-CoA:carnitine CoA-transferase CaiB-like acyl-CoA transferase
MPERASEPRFESIAARSRNIDDLYAIAGAEVAKRSTAEWLQALREAEIPCGPVNTLEALRDDPQLQAIGFFRPYQHPSEGALEVPDAAFRFDRQSLPVRHHQPRLGEHGREVLREAGLTEAEIDAAL